MNKLTNIRVAFGVTKWLVEGAGTDGIGYYTQEMYNRLNCIKKTPIFFGYKKNLLLNNLTVMRFPPYPQSALLSAVTRLNILGSEKLDGLVDLFHAPDHYVPKIKNIPVIATIHDAIPLSNPEWASKRLRREKNWLWLKSTRWADQIITVSDYSKGEIVKYFGIPEKKISVTPAGVDERFFERLKGPIVNEVVKQLKLPERFFMFIGTLQPRKNIERIIDAHMALPKKIRLEVPLIVVGKVGWGSNKLVDRLNSMSLNDGVRWIMGIDDLTKRVMMQKATALLFPSLSEGFGLPVLEGFASGTPVITSNLSSIPEVAGDAAWLLDPYNVEAMTEAMATLACDTKITNNLVEKGLQRARQYSWDACAVKTLKVYEQVIHGLN